MTPPDPLVRAAVLKLAAAAAAAELSRLRPEIGEGLMEGDRIGVPLPGPDGKPVRIGTVARPKDTTSVVVNERQAARWAREHMPDALRVVVDPKVLERWRGEIAEYGGVLVRGEIVEVPWADVVTSPSSLRVEQPRGKEEQEKAWAAVRAAIGRGEVSGVLLPQLESGDGGTG